MDTVTATAPVTHDRTLEDVGNIVALEHVNVQCPDQMLAVAFYIMGLGLTRDPYLTVGTENMWANVGRSQFHLPQRPVQVLRGHVALVIPERRALLARLAKVQPKLEGTKFAVTEYPDYVEAVSPYGNIIRVYEPDEKRFGYMRLGMPYVQLDVPKGNADGIARFYREALLAPATVADEPEGRAARVHIGQAQQLVFRETTKPLPEFDGHHVQIYIANFSAPYRWLKERGLAFADSGRYQYRFKDIMDPQSGKVVYELDHEVRSYTHPLHGRPFVNRNPQQRSPRYIHGLDDLAVEW